LVVIVARRRDQLDALDLAVSAKIFANLFFGDQFGQIPDQ